MKHLHGHLPNNWLDKNTKATELLLEGNLITLIDYNQHRAHFTASENISRATFEKWISLFDKQETVVKSKQIHVFIDISK